MPEPEPRVFTDDGVASAVLDLIREAKEDVVLVTPYSEFWGHLKNEIHRAVERNVRVTAYFREDAVVDPATRDFNQKTRSDAEWLRGVGATVYTVPKLHAKLYLNESSVLLASMNLHQSSSKNSMEVGIRVVDKEDARALRRYAEQLNTNLDAKRLNELRRPVNAVQPASSPPTKAPRTEKPRSRGSTRGITRGRCIRCKRDIPYKFERPLCDKCDKYLAERNRLRGEYCHMCGGREKRTYAEPLCKSCWEDQGRPKRNSPPPR